MEHSSCAIILNVVQLVVYQIVNIEYTIDNEIIERFHTTHFNMLMSFARMSIQFFINCSAKLALIAIVKMK